MTKTGSIAASHGNVAARRHAEVSFHGGGHRTKPRVTRFPLSLLLVWLTTRRLSGRRVAPSQHDLPPVRQLGTDCGPLEPRVRRSRFTDSDQRQIVIRRGIYPRIRNRSALSDKSSTPWPPRRPTDHGRHRARGSGAATG